MSNFEVGRSISSPVKPRKFHRGCQISQRLQILQPHYSNIRSKPTGRRQKWQHCSRNSVGKKKILLFIYISKNKNFFIYIYIFKNIYFKKTKSVVNFCNRAKILHFATPFRSFPFSAPLFCFGHNFFIQIPFWVILVSLESLEIVEYKYILKKHF